MQTQKDSKARHGYQPTWDLQREKQDEIAERFYENRDERREKRRQKYLNPDQE